LRCVIIRALLYTFVMIIVVIVTNARTERQAAPATEQERASIE